MNSLKDPDLLREYVERRSEAAFAELVRRHVNFVYSAALRMVRDAHLAEDVTQTVFVALAKNARQLTERLVLSGWLHRTAQNLAANAVRSDVRRRAREQEAAAMNELFSTESDAAWEDIAPHLDAALGELSEPDRDALLLRYFERKSARDMAQILGVSDEAAQKRVSRAVGHLRQSFAKRGVPVGASGLTAVISVSAVHAAPLGLAAAISTAAALAGNTLATTTITATQAIAMTTLQKTLVGATLAAAIGTAVYEAHDASRWRDQFRTLEQQQTEQLEQFRRAGREATATLAAVSAENERLKSTSSELSRLRGEVSRLRDLDRRAPAPEPAVAAAAPRDEIDNAELPKDSWNDAGFATPAAALQTRGWAVLTGNRERFRQSVFITDDARQTLEDMFVRMAEASNDPNKAQFLEEILENKFGVEEGFLMPMMAENRDKGYTGYRILAQHSPAPDELILEVQTGMTAAPAKTETMTFRRFDGDWKVVIDAAFLKARGVR